MTRFCGDNDLPIHFKYLHYIYPAQLMCSLSVQMYSKPCSRNTLHICPCIVAMQTPSPHVFVYSALSDEELVYTCLLLAQLCQCLCSWQLMPVSLTTASSVQQGCQVSACHLYKPSLHPRSKVPPRIGNTKVLIVSVMVNITKDQGLVCLAPLCLNSHRTTRWKQLLTITKMINLITLLVAQKA